MLRKTLLRLLAIALLFYARTAQAQHEEFWKKIEADKANVLINGTMRDWSDASLSVQRKTLFVLRGGRILGLTREQRSDWTSANIDLGKCMGEHTFPHSDPEAFRPDALVKIAFEACMKQLHIEPSEDPDHPNGPNWKRSEEAEKLQKFMKKVEADIEAAHVLINGTMRDWWEASVSVQGQAVFALRGGSRILLGLTREQTFDWTSASTDLGQCMGEHKFPHADPETFRPETTVKVAFEACMKQLHVEPSTPNHPNGPNWQPSEEIKKRVKADIEAANALINGTMRDWWDASVRVQERAVSELRGGEKPGLAALQLHDYSSANMDLDQCMREHALPGAHPDAFQTTVKIAFESCMKQLRIEPSTDPDHPNGPNWRRSESAERIRQRLWEWDQQKQKQ